MVDTTKEQSVDERLTSNCLPTAFNTDLGLEDAVKGTFTDPDAQRDELFPSNTEKPYVGYVRGDWKWLKRCDGGLRWWIKRVG